jgi:hypothetical protein
MRSRNPLDPFALGVGRLCHAWADLERGLAGLFAFTAGMVSPPYWPMIDCISTRDLVTAIKVGAISVASDAAERDWADEVVSLMDYVDNELRPRRNRYVHDHWIADPRRGVMQSSRTPRLVKAGAFQRRRVQTYNVTPGDLTALRSIVQEVRAQTDWIWELAGWQDIPREGREPMPLAERPQRQFPRPQQETPNPKAKQPRTRSPPPQP